MLKAAVVGVVVVFGLVSCRHTKMAEYRDARDGWTIEYPASMYQNVIAHDGFVSWRGVVIANSEEVKSKPGEATFFRRFPSDGVALGILQLGGGPAPDLSGPEARFPLRRSEFRYVGMGPEPRAHTYGMIANGAPWAVYTWFGPKASQNDQERIWRIVESLRFPPQRPGTMSGSFYVLQKASHYPVGTVVKVLAKDEPFFLVHAPGGMYAVGWEPKFEQKCHMGFDRKRFAFFCATRRGWWNRMGEPMVSPVAGLMPDDALMLGQAKIGRDGQVLVGNWMGLGGPLYKQYEQRFWPDSQ